MRYEFERDGTVVASVLWEGPGQVSGRRDRQQHPRDGGPLPLLRGGLPGRRVRLRRGAGARRAADAPSRLDPVGVRAGVPQPGAPPAGPGPARRDRPGGRAARRGSRDEHGQGRRRACSRPSSRRASRSSSASPAAPACRSTTRWWTVRRSATCCAATSRAPGTPPRATPGPPARSACAWPRAAPAPRTSSRRSPTRRWTRCRSSRSPARCPTPVVGNDAFQEADITGITMPVTKHNFLVKDPADIVRDGPRGLPHRAHRPAGPGADRPAEGRADRRHHLQVARADHAPRLQAHHRRATTAR